MNQTRTVLINTIFCLSLGLSPFNFSSFQPSPHGETQTPLILNTDSTSAAQSKPVNIFETSAPSKKRKSSAFEFLRNRLPIAHTSLIIDLNEFILEYNLAFSENISKSY